MLRSKYSPPVIDIRRGHGEVTLRLERLLLITGVYWIDAYVLDETDSIPLTTVAAQSKEFTVRGASRVSTSEDSGIFERTTEWFQTSDALLSRAG